MPCSPHHCAITAMLCASALSFSTSAGSGRSPRSRFQPMAPTVPIVTSSLGGKPLYLQSTGSSRRARNASAVWTSATVDPEPRVEVEEMELARVDRHLDLRAGPQALGRLEPADHDRPLLERLRLELLESRGVDVAGDLAHLLGQHRLGCQCEM